MINYTPTTDEIRFRVEHGWEPYIDGSFDRWLAEVERGAEARGYEAGYRHGYRDRRFERSFDPHQEETT